MRTQAEKCPLMLLLDGGTSFQASKMTCNNFDAKWDTSMKLVELDSFMSVKKDRMRRQADKCLLVLFSDWGIRFQTSKKDTVITLLQIVLPA